MAERQYTDQQRAAVVAAFAQPETTAKRVTELAAAGELVGADGEVLPGFDVPVSMVRHLKREAGRSTARASRLAVMPHGDAIEDLRQRTIKMADAELAAVESQVEGKRDLERFRQAIRVVTDAAKIPRPTDPRPPSEATGDDNGDGGSTTPGALLQEHRRTASAHDQPTGPPPPAPRVPEPEPEPETALERLRAKHDAELRADIERIKREQQGPEPPPVDDTAALGERARRRQLREDTSSCW